MHTPFAKSSASAAFAQPLQLDVRVMPIHNNGPFGLFIGTDPSVHPFNLLYRSEVPLSIDRTEAIRMAEGILAMILTPELGHLIASKLMSHPSPEAPYVLTHDLGVLS